MKGPVYIGYRSCEVCEHFNKNSKICDRCKHNYPDQFKINLGVIDAYKKQNKGDKQ